MINVRIVDDSIDHIVPQDNDAIIVNGKYYVLDSLRDEHYDDLDYIEWEGETYVEA